VMLPPGLADRLLVEARPVLPRVAEAVAGAVFK
jgi:hypothetical protein